MKLVKHSDESLNQCKMTTESSEGTTVWSQDISKKEHQSSLLAFSIALVWTQPGQYKCHEIMTDVHECRQEHTGMARSTECTSHPGSLFRLQRDTGNGEMHKERKLKRANTWNCFHLWNLDTLWGLDNAITTYHYSIDWVTRSSFGNTDRQMHMRREKSSGLAKPE